MLSIITAVYNQLAANRLFLENIKRYTRNPYELIVIDNASTDGSGAFFAQNGARVIRNPHNYTYPVTQNQGIRAAQYDVFAFLNNDIIVAKDWDERLLASMARHGLEVITCCGIENLETPRATRRFKRRWKLIKGGLGIAGYTYATLKAMHRLMYGDWETFCEKRYRDFKLQIKEGFVGNTVVMKRSAIPKIGFWDERIIGADFDLYLRTQHRCQQHRDIRPVHIALDVFNHHYIRLTVKSKYPPYKDANNLIPLEEKWSAEDLARLPP